MAKVMVVVNAVPQWRLLIRFAMTMTPGGYDHTLTGYHQAQGYFTAVCSPNILCEVLCLVFQWNEVFINL